MIELRPYQGDMVAEIEADPQSRDLIPAPTGSGKTVVAGAIIHRAPNTHVLFLAHRRELIRQTRTHLSEFDVNAGIILAGEPVDHMQRVQVASIQTLHSRCIRHGRDLPPAGIVFVDEAHHAPAKTYRSIIEAYPTAKVIGMTATPCRRDGRGLGGIFDRLIECPQVPELIELGFLVPTKVFAPSTPDLHGVHVRQGDYVESELTEIMDQAKLVGDIVTHWHRLAEGRKTVVFATSVGHSIHLKDEFIRSGVRAEHLDGKTPKDERDDILGRLSAGDLDLVTNCMVLTEGWDQPDVSCCILARPTRSMGLYRQMVGRVIRPATGKDRALILDHAGNTIRHGFVEDRVEWTLDPDTRADNPAHNRRGARETSRLIECEECQAIRTAGAPCPNCGHMPRRPGDYVEHLEGDLQEINRNGSRRRHDDGPERRHEWHRMLVGIAVQRGYKLGWAAYKFREKFGHWPDSRQVAPLDASPEVRSWVRSRQIAWAKSRERRAG